MRKLTVISIITWCLVASCVTNPVTGKKEFGVASFEKEKAQGAEYDPQIVASFGLYEDATIQQYITAKGNEMAAISHNPDYDYEFKIVDSPVVNAFAVPGGYVYFTRGIMAHFNNEAEFAGVLGHEIGHITARHSVKSRRNAVLAQVGVIAGAIAAPELIELNSASQGAQLLLLKFGRDAESQSDELGVEYSSKIGYDAQQMALFFNTLARKQEEAGVSIPEFLSTHPNPVNRKEKVAELALAWKTKLDMNDPKIGRNSYLQMVDGLVYGEDPRQGFVEDWAFYHPELAFSFDVPEGWQYQNSPQQFQMAPEDGSALMFLTLAEGTSLQDAATQTLTSFNMTSTETRETNYNGLPVMTIIATQNASTDEAATTTQGATDPVKAKISLIQYGGLIYNITGLSLSSTFQSQLSTFNATMQSFDVLTDPSKLNKQPERLEVKTVNATASFAQVMSSFGMDASRTEELAILNGMQSTETVEKGTLIKIAK